MTLDGSKQRSEEIALHELEAMFGRAAPRSWPCPDEKILAQCAFLHTVTWVRRWASAETQPRLAWQPEERAVRKALNVLASKLPRLIHPDKALSLLALPAFSHERVAALELLQRLVPIVLEEMGPDLKRGKESARWHAAATLIAAEATDAWTQAGRTKFGCNATSPLVKFTEEFLARAGIEQDPATIAMALQRDRRGKS